MIVSLLMSLAFRTPLTMPRPTTPASPGARDARTRARLHGRSSENVTRHTPRAFVAQLLLVIALALFSGRPARGQDAALPLPSDVMQAWRTVHAWLLDWRAPDEPVALDPPNATGACVTIRLDNRVLGRAADMGEDDRTLYRAARAALAQARERAPLERGPDFDDRLRVLAPLLTLDVQISGAIIPLLGDSFDEAGVSIAPGLDGAAVRVGERIRGAFPATMLAQNATPSSALSALAADLLNEPVNIPGRDLKALREHRALVPYRFGALHLAQTAPGKEPVFLTRASRVIPPTDITASALRAFADHLAQNLRSRIDEQGHLPGPYEPWSDTHTQANAGAPERCLVAFALARYATSPSTSPANALAASRSAWLILDALAGEPSWTDDTASAAAFLIALRSMPARPTDLDPARAPSPDVEQRAVQAIQRAFVDGQWTDELPATLRSLICYAAVLIANGDPDVLPKDTARSMLRTLLAQTPPGQLVSLTPWAVWTELALLDADEPVPSAIALHEMRSLLWQHQVSLADTSAIAPDLLGGIVFTAGAVPLPTWQTARALPALATMLADARLTPPGERAQEFARILLALRFLRQLAADETVVHLFPNPQRAIWGVREALWNQRQPADASAMTLLAVTETLRATRPATESPKKP